MLFLNIPFEQYSSVGSIIVYNAFSIFLASDSKDFDEDFVIYIHKEY